MVAIGVKVPLEYLVSRILPNAQETKLLLNALTQAPASLTTVIALLVSLILVVLCVTDSLPLLVLPSVVTAVLFQDA